MPIIYKDKKHLIDALIQPSDQVLDVGFSGQGIQDNDHKWPHALLQKRAAQVSGVDIVINRDHFPDEARYQEASAESFSFPGKRFNVLFAGDLIEHLTNPGLFLEACRKHMVPEGRLILTTPNTFNLFNIAEKLTKDEPTINRDHTMYFNYKTLRTLFEKCGFEMQDIAYVYTLGYDHKESLKKKFLNGIYWILALGTAKFVETLVVVATVRPSPTHTP